MCDKLFTVVDRFGDRWVRFCDSPSPRFRNFDQDDDSLTLAQLNERDGPLTGNLPHHVTTPGGLARSITPWSA